MFQSKLKTLVVAVASLSASQVIASDQMTIDDIPNIEYVLQSAVSPSGDHIAFTRKLARKLYVDKDGASYSELYITDSKGNERPFITGKVNVKSIEWSADGQHVYFLGKFDKEKHTKLYRIPFMGGERQAVMALKDTSISAYDMSPDGKQVALLAMPAKKKSEKKLKDLGFKAEVKPS